MKKRLLKLLHRITGKHFAAISGTESYREWFYYTPSLDHGHFIECTCGHRVWEHLCSSKCDLPQLTQCERGDVEG